MSYESLFYGCPVLCTDKSHWDKLKEFNCGWNIELTNITKFVSQIEEILDYDFEEYQNNIDGCKQHIESIGDGNQIYMENKKLYSNVH